MRVHLVGTMTVAKFLAGEEEEMNLRIAAHDDWRRSVRLASRKSKNSRKGSVK